MSYVCLCTTMSFSLLCAIQMHLLMRFLRPDEVEQWCWSSLNPHFPSCTGIIAGTIVKIQKPWNNFNHTKWFNGHKKMHYMNDMVVVSHIALFIHLDLGFSGFLPQRYDSSPLRLLYVLTFTHVTNTWSICLEILAILTRISL